MLGVARPEPTRETGYAFEYDVTEHHPDGSTTKGRIDLYKRQYVVLEAKRFSQVRPEDVGEILETLCAVRKARRGKADRTFLP